MATSKTNLKTVKIDTKGNGCFYLKRQEVTRGIDGKPIYRMELTRSKSWALKVDPIMHGDITSDINIKIEIGHFKKIAADYAF